MKTFLITILFPLLGFAAEVDSREISKQLDKVEPYVYGIAVHKLKGKTADELIRALAKENQADEVTIDNFPSSLPGGDEGGGVYGQCKLVDARDLALSEYESRATELDPPGDIKKARKVVHAAFWAMKEAGAKFGYTSDGSSVCGVTWPSPLVIDVKAKKIYELLLVGGGC